MINNYEEINRQQSEIKSTIDDLSATVRSLEAAATSGPDPASVEEMYDALMKDGATILPAAGPTD